MKLEDINTVGWIGHKMQYHVFDCHEEIRRLNNGINRIIVEIQQEILSRPDAPNLGKKGCLSRLEHLISKEDE